MSEKPLKVSASLWSADMANLEADIRRVDPYVDMYHLDVADGVYAPVLLFFPDLVKAIRPKTDKPFEVHLITTDPQRWVEPFAEAGADRIIFYLDSTDSPDEVVQAVKARGLNLGISLGVDHPAAMLEPYHGEIDLVCVMGTGFGVKGVTDVAEGTCEKIRGLAALRKDLGLDVQIESDGAIRRHTVPKLRAAGADVIVPGSLLFGSSRQQFEEIIRSA